MQMIGLLDNLFASFSCCTCNFFHIKKNLVEDALNNLQVDLSKVSFFWKFCIFLGFVLVLFTFVCFVIVG